MQHIYDINGHRGRLLMRLVCGCAALCCGGCIELLGPGSSLNADDSAARRLAAPEFAPASVQRIAVLVRNESGRFVPDGTLRRIDDEVTAVLIQKDYTIAARTDMAAVAWEQQLQQSGQIEASAPQVGRMANAKAVLVLSLTSQSTSPLRVDYRRPKDKTVYHRTEYVVSGAISARLIGVERGEVLWLADHRGSTRALQPEQATDLLPSLAAEVTRALPAFPRPVAPSTQPGP